MEISDYHYLKGLCKASELKNATKALSYIREHHDNQVRDDGTPYFSHPVKVALHLSSLGLYKDNLWEKDILLSGALLHDVIEDTNVTKYELATVFNEPIANVVHLLTKTKDFSNETYYANLKTNSLASLIKIADRCNNISTMAGVFTKARLTKYINETNSLVFPLIRHTRDNNSDISDQVVVMSYHIKSVIAAIEVMLPLMKD